MIGISIIGVSVYKEGRNEWLIGIDTSVHI